LGQFSLEKLFGMTIRESADDGSDFTNPDADYRRLFLGEDGLLHLKDSAGAVTTPGGGASDLDTVIAASSGQDVADALSGAAAPAAGNVFATMADVGGGGLAQSFVGYDTIGGTWTQMVAQKEYLKKVTLSATSTMTSIDAHVRGNADNFATIAGVLLSDNAGAPGILLAAAGTVSPFQYFSISASMPTAGRWFSMSLGATLAAGDYWIGVVANSTVLDLANDGSGADVTIQLSGSGSLFVSAKYTSFTQSTTSVKNSIRASILS